MQQVRPNIATVSKVNVTRLKRVIRTALDGYLDEVRVPAALLHAEAALAMALRTVRRVIT